jgi:hypothetical protein
LLRFSAGEEIRGLDFCARKNGHFFAVSSGKSPSKLSGRLQGYFFGLIRPEMGNYRDKSRINWANTNHYFSSGPIRAQKGHCHACTNTVRRVIEVSRSEKSRPVRIQFPLGNAVAELIHVEFLVAAFWLYTQKRLFHQPTRGVLLNGLALNTNHSLKETRRKNCKCAHAEAAA